MQCSHCGYSCGPKGKHATIETIKNAIDINREYFDGNLFIGGGEPTLHPQFWEIFGIMLGATVSNNDLNLGMVTNGTIPKTALTLAKLNNSEIFYCALSLDDLHYPRPDKEVIEAFGSNIRSTQYARVTPVGRAKRHFAGNDFQCLCEDILVDEKGFLYTCGCKNFKLGNVNDVTPLMVNNIKEYAIIRDTMLDGYNCLNERNVKPSLRKSFRNFLKYGDSNGRAT